jgi:hypothetical protein
LCQPPSLYSPECVEGEFCELRQNSAEQKPPACLYQGLLKIFGFRYLTRRYQPPPETSSVSGSLCTPQNLPRALVSSRCACVAFELMLYGPLFY